MAGNGGLAGDALDGPTNPDRTSALTNGFVTFTIGEIWNQKALSEAPVSLDKMKIVADKAMTKCDDVDGLKDGLIDDPRGCSFDPRAMYRRGRQAPIPLTV